jgi:26S proteasome regulatory subunit N11
VVIDAFRLINPNMMVLGQEPRQTTSNLGHLQKPSIQVTCAMIQYGVFEKSMQCCTGNNLPLCFLSFKALIHGLNRHYYSISINYRKNELEQKVWLTLLFKSEYKRAVMLRACIAWC